jgi:hypothetical protein
MTRAWSRRQEEPSGQQVEPGSAKHLALQHLQAVDLPFDGALTSGLGGEVIGTARSWSTS